MEPLDDTHYLTEPEEPGWCLDHQCYKPCAACRYEERD